MRKIFIIFLFCNLVLLALNLFMPNLATDQRESYRVANEVQPSMVIIGSTAPTLSPEGAKNGATEPPPPVTPPPVTPPPNDPLPEVPPPTPVAPAPSAPNPEPSSTVQTSAVITEKMICKRVNNLSESSANALKEWLKQTNPSITYTEKRDAATKKTWIVLYPPSKNADEAQAAANRLKKQGVDDLFIIVQKGPQQHGISLGVFSSEAGAKEAKADFEKMGIANLSIYTRDNGKYQFTFHQLTESQASYLARNPQHTQNGLVNCK